MCGIYGAISRRDGPKWDLSAIKALTWANRERGTHSLGFFDSSGRTMKRADDPAKSLTFDKVRIWLTNSQGNAWAIGGHTRHATQGGITKQNAHPFKYGHIVGTHNGMVDAPVQYTVDSEYLFDLISERGHTGIEAVHGYWGLAWLDRNEDKFYLTKHNGSLAYCFFNGVYYYSSDKDHLASIIDADPIELKEGQVLCFTADGQLLDSETGAVEKIDALYGYYDYGYYTGGKRSRYTGGTTSGIVRTYDYGSKGTAATTLKDELAESRSDDWHDSWDRFFRDMSDEQFQAWEGLV